MNRILFLTSEFNEKNKGNLNVDLVNKFSEKGYSIDVMTPIERKKKYKTQFIKGLINIVKFKALNFRGQVNFFEKGISTLTLGILYKLNFKRFLKENKYSVVIYTTLPTTYGIFLKYLKKRYNLICYLLHKDFFPQSAIDLGILRKKSLIYKLFRKIEKNLYHNSDLIGVMSKKNKEYLLEMNKEVIKEKVHVIPNSINPTDSNVIKKMKQKRDSILELYGLPKNKLLLIYGGNISRSQGINFILKFVKKIEQEKEIFLIFVGSGNEFPKLKKFISDNNIKNSMIIPFLIKKEYDKLAAVCDIGLVFLDYRFTIANIPSRMLSHMDYEQPILAATDTYTDLKEIIEDNKIGLWSSSDDVEKFVEKINVIRKNYLMYSENSKKCLIDYFSSEKTFNKMQKKIREKINV